MSVWKASVFTSHYAFSVNLVHMILHAFDLRFPIKDAEIKTMALYPFHQLGVSILVTRRLLYPLWIQIPSSQYAMAFHLLIRRIPQK